jgi:DNA-binding phage protein
MALTRDFKETIVARVKEDPAFARALFDEALNLMYEGETKTARLVLRDLVNATVGFQSLATITHKESKSVQRMLSASGNPTMENLSIIIKTIKDALNVEIKTNVVPV